MTLLRMPILFAAVLYRNGTGAVPYKNIARTYIPPEAYNIPV